MNKDKRLKKANTAIRIVKCNFGRVVLMQKGKMREYVRDDNANSVKMSYSNRQGKLDAMTRKVFRQLAEMILLGLGGDD